MKTITEFVAVTFKTADRVRGELTTAGKTPEEIPAGLGEALKLEGDKLTHFMSALELVGTKTSDLKRVVVFTLAENEKPPARAQEKNGTWFLVEYYPPVAGAAPRGGDRKTEGRGGRRGDKKGGRGGARDDKKRGGRGPRREGGDRPAMSAEGAAPAAGGGGNRPPRGERTSKRPKIENVPYVPGAPMGDRKVFKITPKGASATEQKPATEAPTAESPSGADQTPTS